MLYYGKYITEPGDPLQAIRIEQLYRVLVQPKPPFADRIQQLRQLRAIDENAYRQQKRTLPYLVCGRFHPLVRRRENFVSIEYFILDIDHVEALDLTPGALRTQLSAVGPNLLMAFLSPSADGIKLLFRLRQRCTDAALFSAFYKAFAHAFAEQRGLLQAVDFRTNDVTRACFISTDPETYYNPEAAPVDMDEYINSQDFHQTEKILRKAEKQLRSESPPKPPASADPSADVLLRIRQKLNPNARKPRDKTYHIPEEVDEVLPRLRERLTGYEMQIVETGPLAYGRKVKVQAGPLWAEINIYYGKKGFSVVKTTKSGSNEELAQLAGQVIAELLDEIHN